VSCARTLKDANVDVEGNNVRHAGSKQLGGQNAITTTDIKHALCGLWNCL